jgi:hypothetical protein
VILGSKSLRAAMAAVGTCGLAATSIQYAITARTAAAAKFKPGISAPVVTVCPDLKPALTGASQSSALSSMWAWGNPVPTKVDARGLGEPAMAPAAIAAFSTRRALADVRLSVPWASNEGTAIRQWLSGSVSALHAGGQTVSMLGGDNGWVANPALATQWMTAAHSVAPFDGVQFDVEPWTDQPNWTSDAVAISKYVALVRQAEASAHSLRMKFNLDAPWWLATTAYGSGTALSALLPYSDTVSIVAYSDHADGMDGIIAQAWTAVTQSIGAGVPFTIGVQTSSDTISGGAQYTFADSGSAALETESAKVRAAYATSAGYSGVTVEEYLSWATLKP